MITVAPVSVATVYSDLMAFILISGLFYMFRQYRLWRNPEGDRIFQLLCVMVMINAVSNGFSYALHHNAVNLPQPVRMLLPTIAEYSVLLVMHVWFLFVECKLYQSMDRIRKRHMLFSIPMVILLILFVVNLFTGFLFTVDEHSNFVWKPLFAVITILQYTYGIVPVGAIIHYIRLHGRLKFFHLTPVVMPVVVSCLFTLFSVYSARSFGFTLALVFMHFANANYWRFTDGESGFFNSLYLEEELSRKRIGSELPFSVDNPKKELFTILRTELPKDAEIIRQTEKDFLIIMEKGDAAAIQFLSTMLEEAVSEYDEEHPEAPIGFSVRINSEE